MARHVAGLGKLLFVPYRLLADWRASDRIGFRRHRGKVALGAVTGAAAIGLDFQSLFLGIDLVPRAIAVLAALCVAPIPWLVEHFESRSEPEGGRRRRKRALGSAATGSLEQFEIENISVTGALLRTHADLLKVGQRLELALSLHDASDAPEISVNVRVVRKQRPSWEAVGGVGVEFLDLPKRQREAIRKFVDGEQSVPLQA